MEFRIQVFIVLLVSGLTLVGAEVFIPGGILGTIGGLALFGAAITGFVVFGPVTGGYIAVGILFLVGIVIALWIKFFPRSFIGRKMTVSADLADSKGTEDDIEELLGRDGIAISQLRPAGFAEIDGRRVDVVTQGEMIESNERIRVIDVESNRVVIARAE